MSRRTLRVASSAASVVVVLLLGFRPSHAGWDIDWTRLSDGAPAKFLAAPAFVSTGPEQLEVFGSANDGAVWHRAFDGIAWSAWNASDAPAGGAASAPALSYGGAGITHMAIRGRNGEIYYRYRSGQADWSGWTSLGGKTSDGPAITADQKRGRVDIWVRGGDGNLWQRQGTGSAWDPWHISGGSPPGGLQSAPAAVNRGDVVDIVARGAGGKVWHRAWDAARSEWLSAPGQSSGWEPLGGGTSTAPSVSAFGTDQLHVWARGPASDATIYHKRYAQRRWGEFVAEGAPASGTASVSALHWGTPSRPRVAVGVLSGNDFFYRGWEENAPVAIVGGALDRIVSPPAGSGAAWENTTLVVPPGKAGSAAGSVLFSIGCAGTVWRGDYAALTAATPGGGAAEAPRVPVIGQDLASLVPASVKLADPKRLGSCDNIITRLPDGALMLVRQAVITGSPNGGASTQRRGAEITFVSRDGGITWEYQSVVDPFDPAFANGRFGKTKSQGGLDRPELLVPSRGDRVFMSIHGLGDQGGKGLIFATTAPYGKRWTLVEQALPYTAPYMMTATQDRLFVFNLQDGSPDNYDAVVRWYDLARDGTAPIKANGPFMVAPKDAFAVLKEPGSNGAAEPVSDGSVAITVIGHYGAETYLRVAYPHVDKASGARQVLRTHVVKVAGNTASLVPGGSLTLTAQSAEGSLLDLVAVELDHHDLPSRSAVRPVLYYWKETQTTPANGLVGEGWGKVVLRGRIVRGLADWSESFVLSRNPDNSERSWNAHRRTGDYSRGAFFLDPPGGGNAGKLRFFTQWSETPLRLGKWESIMHTNIVAVDP